MHKSINGMFKLVWAKCQGNKFEKKKLHEAKKYCNDFTSFRIGPLYNKKPVFFLFCPCVFYCMIERIYFFIPVALEQ